MNLALVQPIVNAVLYEGYMLYPYRASSVKNRQRWTFGGLYPRAYSLAQSGSDAWSTQMECLVAGDERTLLDLKVRFLHPLARDIGVLAVPVPEITDEEPDFQVIDTLEVGGRLFQTWQEAVEREVDAENLSLGEIAAHPRRLAFTFPAWRDLEPLCEAGGPVVGVIARRQEPIEGLIEIAAKGAGNRLYHVTIRVTNLTELEDASHKSRDEVLMRSFASTHIIVGAQSGQFVSLLDPPDHLREIAARCRNLGIWPVLVGEPGARDLLLASPIILYDYPQIAPESPGDLFDGTEIDEILMLRIMTMTQKEKREMGALDERTRTLLERTETVACDQLVRLHGTIRSLRPLEEQ